MNKQFNDAVIVLSDLAHSGSEEIRLEAATTLLLTANMAGTEGPVQNESILKEAVETHDNLFDQIGHVLSQTMSEMAEDGTFDWNDAREIEHLINAIRPLIVCKRETIELELPQGDERELIIVMDTLIENKRMLCVKIEDTVLQKQNKADADALRKVREAIYEYYACLTARKHASISQNAAFNKIQDVLGMAWKG